MIGQSGAVTVGIDIGTTSVKAVSVDEDGRILNRSRIAHRLFHPAADQIQHDAIQAWRRGPSKALAAVVSQGTRVSGICVTGMVPSLTAVGSRGMPRAPGVLYDDARARIESSHDGSAETGVLDNDAAKAMLMWMSKEVPDARGFWPAQAVANYGLGGPPAIDSAVASSMGSLMRRGRWDTAVLEEIGVAERQLAEVALMGEAVGTVPMSRLCGGAAIAGGTVDALCDQIVSGAVKAGDVLVICGATLIVWAVVDDWIEPPGLWTVPHTVSGKVLVGGASNAGGLFVDWARSLLGRTSHNVTTQSSSRSGRTAPAAVPPTACEPSGVPIWIPYLRGERVPYHDPYRRSEIRRLDVCHDPDGLERAVYESSGFVVRHILERAGVAPQRIVASGGGTRSTAWMQALADCTGLPVDPCAVSEGAALGAAFVARMAAGLETSLDNAQSWASIGARVEPDPRWRDAVEERYSTFISLSEEGRTAK